ncbi:MAG: hypothetical protein ACJ79P_16715 [Myxococcales bacterium]
MAVRPIGRSGLCPRRQSRRPAGRRIGGLAALLLAAAYACKKEPPPPEPPPPPPPASERPPQKIVEIEPNDFQRAQAVPERCVIEGTFEPERRRVPDDDWYRVAPGPGRTLALRVELFVAEPDAGAAEAVLEVLDRDRNRLLRVPAVSGSAALIPAVACADACFVRASSAQRTSYTLSILGAAPRPDHELEPNDRLIDATVQKPGARMQGTYGSPEDEDWYRVEVKEARRGQFLHVELSGVAGVRAEMEIRGLDGTSIGVVRGAAEGEGISIRDLALVRETEVADAGVAVDGGAPAKPFDGGGAIDGGRVADAGILDAGLPVDGGVGDAGTPVDGGVGDAGTPVDGGVGDAGMTVDGGVGDAGTPVDGGVGDAGMPVDGAAGDAGMPVDGGVVTAGTFDAGTPDGGVGATTPDGGPTAVVASIADAGTPDAGVVAPPPRGFVFVVRSGVIEGPAGKRLRGADPRVPYTLIATVEQGPEDLEIEPNDEMSRATDIGPSGTRSGYLAPAGDADFYLVRVERPTILHAEVSGLERADVEMLVLAPGVRAGARPVVLARANEGGLREGEVIPALGIPAGDTYVEIVGAARQLEGKPVRDAEDRDHLYKLSLSLLPDDGTTEREPNNDPLRAQQVALPAAVKGYIWPRRDVDCFRFHVAVRSGTLTTRVFPGRGMDLQLRLSEIHGKRADVIGTADAMRGEGEEAMVAVPVREGDYAVEVSSPRNKDSSPSEPYEVQIRLDGPGLPQ